MDTIIFATGNKNKMIEIRMILADLGCKILSQKEAGIQADVVEDGQTFEENALIKATTIADIARKMPEYKNAVVLADDSGLEIDALNKEPGIYSARYMGEDTSYDIKNQALIDRLEGVPDEKRTARFVCAIAAALPDGSTEVVRGTMEGRIGYEITGENGFGYDPIFYLPQARQGVRRQAAVQTRKAENRTAGACRPLRCCRNRRNVRPLRPGDVVQTLCGLCALRSGKV